MKVSLRLADKVVRSRYLHYHQFDHTAHSCSLHIRQYTAVESAIWQQLLKGYALIDVYQDRVHGDNHNVGQIVGHCFKEAQKKPIAIDLFNIWSGWWESNSRSQLGRLKFYHWTTPASLDCSNNIHHFFWLCNTFFEFFSLFLQPDSYSFERVCKTIRDIVYGFIIDFLTIWFCAFLYTLMNIGQGVSFPGRRRVAL